MNTKNLLLSGLIALSLAAVSARAVVLPGSDIGGILNAVSGDLVIGFQNASATNDLVIDIGQYTSYEGVAPGTYTIAAFNAAGPTTRNTPRPPKFSPMAVFYRVYRP